MRNAIIYYKSVLSFELYDYLRCLSVPKDQDLVLLSDTWDIKIWFGKKIFNWTLFIGSIFLASNVALILFFLV